MECVETCEPIDGVCDKTMRCVVRCRHHYARKQQIFQDIARFLAGRYCFRNRWHLSHATRVSLGFDDDWQASCDLASDICRGIELVPSYF